MKIKLLVQRALVVLCLFFLLSQSESILTGAKSGLLLWFQTVLPALLPYLILSNLLLHTNVIETFLRPFSRQLQWCLGLSPAGTYALVSGILCGYPFGSKITRDLYVSKELSLNEANYLLGFVNNPSPGFLINYVLLEMLELRTWYPVLLLYYISLFLTIQILRLLRPVWVPSVTIQEEKTAPQKKETSASPSKGEILDVSIMNGFETITKLGGYIMLCTILQTTVGRLLPTGHLLSSVLSATFEITSGVLLLSQLPLSPNGQLVAILTLVTSGGVCIFFQTCSVLAQSGLSVKHYLKGKLLHTILTACILILFSQIV